MAVKFHNNLLERISDNDLPIPFDVVHMAEVINHIRDPIATLARIHDRILGENGLVIVETSNDFNSLQKAIVKLYDDVPWWIVPDHISYFDLSSLKKLLERTGFVVRKVQSTFPMEIFALMGENYRQDSDVGKKCHRRRVDFELNLDCVGMTSVRQRLYSALAEAGFGRSILIYAQKG
jgi:hypothetical protein